jgi:outer membrane receptor protein involved in Fe transport
MKAGHVVGIVKDDAGAVVVGVAVTAIGTTHAQARTDTDGRFRLALVPGDYILRAAREGYVSPYRESVRIRAASQLERTITITRQAELTERPVIRAGVGPRIGEPTQLPLASAVRPLKSESQQAWYLRHLPRTVLRDEGGPSQRDERRTDFKYLPGFLDWAVAESARATSAFFSETDFTGQFNMLTSSALSAVSGGENAMPRGVAYLSVGAAVGTHGDVRMRGAMSTAGLASWVALAEYEARDIQPHAFRVGMSYGAQRVADTQKMSIVGEDGRGRAVASLYAFDRWRLQPGLELNFGARVDRYDYVAGRNFISPELGVRAMVLPRTFVSAHASSAVLAPGIDEFTPPPSSGPWLPPERSFSPLFGGEALVPERIRRVTVGLTREFGPIGHARELGVRWFREDTTDQLATIFGDGHSRGLGHYYVASAGDVMVQGWTLHASGWFTSRVRMSVDYSLAQTEWSRSLHATVMAAVDPAVVRPTRERLHDVTGAIDARIPESDTHVQLAYRFNSTLMAGQSQGLSALGDGRFDVQLRQALPFQPIDGGRFEVMFAINNLLRDPNGSIAGAFYDELLTVRSPRRVLGGVQVRF